MSDINELNEKIAELEKQRDDLAEKTGGFNVGDKVVIEGVVSEIEDSDNHPLKVRMKGGKYGYFRPGHLRHATTDDPVCWANFYAGCYTPLHLHWSEGCAKSYATPSATEIAVPLYRTPPDASKRIAELEKQAADKHKHILHLEAKLAAQRKVKAGLHQAICDRNASIKELEAAVESEKENVVSVTYAENQDLRDMVAVKNARIALLQDWLAKASAFKSKPAEPAPTGDDVATDHIVEPNKMVVAPKGVKATIKDCLSELVMSPCHTNRTVMSDVNQALDQIVELPEPSDWAVGITRLGVPPTEGCGLEFQGHELDIAAALIKAAQEVEP